MHVLIIEHENKIIHEIVHELNRLNIFDPVVIKDVNSVDPANYKDFDLILIEYNSDHKDPFDIAYQFQKASSSSVIVFLTQFQNDETEVFERYNLEYMLKPINPNRIKLAVQKAKKNKEKRVQKFTGNVSIKLFGNMEVKMNSHNVRFMHRKQKEIIAYLLLNDMNASCYQLAKQLIMRKESCFACHEIKALIYLLRNDLEIIDDYMSIEFVNERYYLNLRNVDVDYFNFMGINTERIAIQKLELTLCQYRKGLLSNLSNSWQEYFVDESKVQFFAIQHQLIERFEEKREYEKLRLTLSSIKPYIESAEEWSYFERVVRKNFSNESRDYLLLTGNSIP